MRILAFTLSLCLAVGAFAQQKRVNGVEVMSANGGHGTNTANFGSFTNFGLAIVTNGNALTGVDIRGNTNTYFQLNIKNFNTSAGASSDLVATGPGGNETAHYINVGYSGPNGSEFPFTNGNQGYIYTLGNGMTNGNLHIGAVGSNSALHFYTGLTNPTVNPPLRMTINTNGNVGIGTATPEALLVVNNGTMAFKTTGTNGYQSTNRVGGTYHVTVVPVPTIVGSTMLYTNFIPAHMLTNNGDSVSFEIAGVFRNAFTSTNGFTLSYGSETIIQIGNGFSNQTYQVRGTITRVGNVQQAVVASFLFKGIDVSGPVYNMTNAVMYTAQTNGQDTRFQLASLGIAAANSMTNIVGRMEYKPVP